MKKNKKKIEEMIRLGDLHEEEQEENRGDDYD
jgi:hypothetical protein